MEQEQAEKQRLKEEAERKRKAEERKRKKRMLEAAFDGDVDGMAQILKEVSSAVIAWLIFYWKLLKGFWQKSADHRSDAT